MTFFIECVEHVDFPRGWSDLVTSFRVLVFYVFIKNDKGKKNIKYTTRFI